MSIMEQKYLKQLYEANKKNEKLKEALEAIRTTIVDIFDKRTKDGDADLYLDALIRIERTIRECEL